jgi:beta-lactamase regulating signal transducer with metallopeptidase domain
VPVATWLALALGTGVAIRLAWLGLGLFRLRQISSRAARADERSMLFADVRARLDVNAELRITDEVDGPATVGAWPAVVLLPARALALTEAAQRAILCHELIHVRRRDWLHTLSEEFLRSVLWFHPAARVLTSRISLAREMLVDQRSSRGSGSRWWRNRRSSSTTLASWQTCAHPPSAPVRSHALRRTTSPFSSAFVTPTTKRNAC